MISPRGQFQALHLVALSCAEQQDFRRPSPIVANSPFGESRRFSLEIGGSNRRPHRYSARRLLSPTGSPSWQGQSRRRFTQKHVRCRDDAYKCKQRDRRPFKPGGLAGLTHKHLAEDADDAKGSRIEMFGTADDQAESRSHGAAVGSQIDHVGDDQKQDDRMQQPRRIMTTQGFRDAAAGHPSDPRAGLAVGRDAAGIVVRRARHQPRPRRFRNSRGVRSKILNIL